MSLPRWYGWRSLPSDSWAINHMIHNQYPHPRPRLHHLRHRLRPGQLAAGAADANGQHALDGRRAVSAIRSSTCCAAADGAGKVTYPDDVPSAYAGDVTRNRWVVDRPVTLVHTFGHLHPGGLTRTSGQPATACGGGLFRSRAKYYEPAGPVSWDVSMEATRPDWSVSLKPGDVVSRQRHVRDRARGLVRVDGDHAGRGHGGRPRRRPVHRAARQPARLTHGHLPENRNHGGRPGVLPDARDLLDGPLPGGGTRADQGLRLRPGRPVGPARRAGARPVSARHVADVPERRRGADDLPHDHGLPGAVQPVDGRGLSARQRAGVVRLGRARLRARGPHRRGASRHVVDAADLRAAPTPTSAASIRSCEGAFRVKD